MKKKIINITILAVLVLGIAARPSSAQGLLGKRYIGFEISQTTPGNDDIKEIDDSILGFGGGINVPINKNFDAFFNLSHEQLKGDLIGLDIESTATAFIGGLNYHFLPDKNVDPFVGAAAGLVKTKIEASYLGYEISDDEDDLTFSVGGGVEIDLNNQMSLRPNIGYVYFDDEHDFLVGIGLNVWFNKSVFGGLGVSYGFDEGDISYSASLGFGF